MLQNIPRNAANKSIQKWCRLAEWLVNQILPGYVYVSSTLIEFGLMTPYSNCDLGKHWHRYYLVAWWYQAITRTNVNSSSMGFFGTDLRSISQEMFQMHFFFLNELEWQHFFQVGLMIYSNTFYAILTIYLSTEYGVGDTVRLLEFTIADEQKRPSIYGHQYKWVWLSYFLDILDGIRFLCEIVT